VQSSDQGIINALILVASVSKEGIEVITVEGLS